MLGAVAEPTYTDADLDAAITAISEPGRLQEAQNLVARAAPALQTVLGIALEEGGWFGGAHAQAVREAAGGEDAETRLRAVQTLIAEETRLGMFVGVAVGFELARSLAASPSESGEVRIDPQPKTQEE
jgi:hypothetical protein